MFLLIQSYSSKHFKLLLIVYCTYVLTLIFLIFFQKVFFYFNFVPYSIKCFGLFCYYYDCNCLFNTLLISTFSIIYKTEDSLFKIFFFTFFSLSIYNNNEYISCIFQIIPAAQMLKNLVLHERKQKPSSQKISIRNWLNKVCQVEPLLYVI